MITFFHTFPIHYLQIRITESFIQCTLIYARVFTPNFSTNIPSFIRAACPVHIRSLVSQHYELDSCNLNFLPMQYAKFCIAIFRNQKLCESYVYWSVHHLYSWIKRDQLDVTCFFISLFNAQRVSDVNIYRLKPASGYHTTTAKPQRNTNTHRTRAIQPMK